MNRLKTVDQFLQNELKISEIPRDSSNNGLQVEGKDTVDRALFAVDASLELFEYAAENSFDFIFVHHGLSWGDSLKRITGLNIKRLRPLIKNDISLYAVHLPLDAHPEHGHNAQLANFLGLENREMFSKYSGAEIGVYGELEEELSVEETAVLLSGKLKGNYSIYGDNERKIKKVGIISGGGGSGITDAAKLDLDCFITGEIKHDHYHTIKELDIPVIALGHYCSEKPGIFAVMELIRDRFNIDCEFYDIPTGL